MKSLKILLVVMISSLGAAQAQQVAGPAEWVAAQSAYNDEWKTVESLEGVSIPLLLAPGLEKKWGKPQIRIAPDGSYWLHYIDPENSLELVAIYAFAKPIPQLSSAPAMSEDVMKNGELATAERPQGFQTANMKIPTPNGKARFKLHYFREYAGGGADGPIDTTDTMHFTVNGKTGYYVVKVMSVSKAFSKRIKELEVR